MSIDTPREELLQEATKAVCADRNQTYGSPTANFERAASLSSTLLGQPIQPHQIALILMTVKMSRLVETPEHGDSWIDIAGYAACGYETVAKKERKKERNKEDVV